MDEVNSYERVGAYGTSSRECENFGIPKIYFAGAIENFNVIALTRLDFTLEDIMKKRLQNEDDVLCVFRDVVSILTFR